MNRWFGRSALQLFLALLIMLGSAGPAGYSYADVARGVAGGTVVVPVSVAAAGLPLAGFVAGVAGDLTVHVARAPQAEPADEPGACALAGVWRLGAATGFVGGACRRGLNGAVHIIPTVSAIELSSPENGILRVTVAFN